MAYVRYGELRFYSIQELRSQPPRSKVLIGLVTKMLFTTCAEKLPAL